MPSTYTLNNGIELIGTGEQSGTWGDTTNTNLELLDTALDGQVTVTLASAGTSGSPNPLPITDGATSNGRNRMIIFNDGADLGATAYVKLTPNDAEKIIYIRNSLSGSRDIIVFQGTYNASNDYVIPNGTTAVIFFDGAGSGAVAANVFNNAHFDALNVAGTSTFGDDVTFTGANYNVVWDKSDDALEFADSAKAVFGADSDLQIYHDGTHSIIQDAGTGDLRLYGNNVKIKNADNTAAYIQGINGAEVNLYYNNDLKLATTSAGIDVTGTVTMDGGSTSADFTFGDDDKAVFGAGSDLSIFHGTDNTLDGSFIIDSGTGALNQQASQINFWDADRTNQFASWNVSSLKGYVGNTLITNVTSGGLAVTANNLSLTSSAATTLFTLESTNDGATDGPVIKLYRNSASPAADDDIGRIDFNGKNSADTEIVYSRIESYIETPTDASEDGRMRFLLYSGGSPNVNFIDLDATQGGADGRIGFNLGGADIDFVVRGDTDNELIVADASTNRVGISIASPLDKLHVEDNIRIEGVTPRLRFAESDGTADENYQIVVSGGNLQFLRNNDTFSSGSLRFDMDQSGNTAISNNGTVATTDARLLLRQTDGQVGLRVTNEDGDANIDPIVDIFRDSSTPADNDFIGRLNFSGNNDADQALAYARFQAKIIDVTDGNEDGQMQFQTRYNGAMSNFITYLGGDQGSVNINQSQLDIDFQVRTSGDTHALFVEGSSNLVGVGESAPEDKLHVNGRIRIDSTVPTIRFQETDTTDENWEIVVAAGTLKFRENNDAFDSPSSRMDIVQGGDIRIGSDLDVDHGGVVQIATANNNTQLALVSTDADSAVGPDLKLLRASASPADGDNTGRIRFVAYDSAGTEQTFARISSSAATVLDTDEDGLLEFDVVKNGVVDSRLLFNATTTIFNNDQKDVDFRVEGTGKTYALMVSAGNDRVGIGTGTPAAPLHILDSGTGNMLQLECTDANTADVAPELVLYRHVDTPADGDLGGGIEFNFDDSTNVQTTFARIYSAANDVTNGTEDGAMYFQARTNGTMVEQMRVDQGGVGIGGVTAETGVDLQVQGTVKISKTNNDPGLILECTDGDVNNGPNLLLDRNSGSPANNDNLGAITYKGRNSLDEEIDYVVVRAEARTVTDGNEDGRYQISVMMDGASQNVFDIDIDGASNEVVINEAGLDIDFRVEGISSGSLLRTRASTDTVMMETSATITSGPTLACHQGASNITAEFFRGSATGTATIVNMYSDVGGSNTLQHHFEANGDLEIQGTLTEASDERIKQDIVDSGSQWDDIKAVQVRKYRKIWDVEQYGDDADVLLGVVAQELEASGMGGLVKTRVNEEDPNDDLKSVKYSILYMKAIKALQEAMERIETLEAKVTALENS